MLLFQSSIRPTLCPGPNRLCDRGASPELHLLLGTYSSLYQLRTHQSQRHYLLLQHCLALPRPPPASARSPITTSKIDSSLPSFAPPVSCSCPIYPSLPLYFLALNVAYVQPNKKGMIRCQIGTYSRCALFRPSTLGFKLVRATPTSCIMFHYFNYGVFSSE